MTKATKAKTTRNENKTKAELIKMINDLKDRPCTAMKTRAAISTMEKFHFHNHVKEIKNSNYTRQGYCGGFKACAEMSGCESLIKLANEMHERFEAEKHTGCY